MQKQEFAIVGSHGPAYATPLLLKLRPDRDRIHIGGRRRTVCRLSSGLNRTSQRLFNRGMPCGRHTWTSLDLVMCVKFFCQREPSEQQSIGIKDDPRQLGKDDVGKR
jgi:hypothetical protein